MDNIIIKTEKDTPYIPKVVFDAKNGECCIEGESFMDNTFEFYSPLIEWLKLYKVVIKEPLKLIIKLTYFNTSTSRLLLEILEVIKEYQNDSGIVEVIWYCDMNDPDMMDEVEDFKSESGVEIQLIKT